MKNQNIFWIVIISLLITTIDQALSDIDNCSDNISITYSDNMVGTFPRSIPLTISDTAPICAEMDDPDQCFLGLAWVYFQHTASNLTFSLSANISLSSFSPTASEILYYNSSGNYSLNATFYSANNEAMCFYNITMELGIGPNISVNITNIPNYLLTNTNYNVTIVLNNSGDATSEDLNGILYVNTTEYTAINDSFVYDLPANTTAYHNVTLNFQTSGDYGIGFPEGHALGYSYGLNQNVELPLIPIHVNVNPIIYNETEDHGFLSQYSIEFNTSNLTFNLSNNESGYYYDAETDLPFLNDSNATIQAFNTTGTGTTLNFNVEFNNQTRGVTIISLGNWTGGVNVTLFVLNVFNVSTNFSFVVRVHNLEEEECDSIDNNLDGQNNEGLIGTTMSVGEIIENNNGQCTRFVTECSSNGPSGSTVNVDCPHEGSSGRNSFTIPIVDVPPASNSSSLNLTFYGQTIDDFNNVLRDYINLILNVGELKEFCVPQRAGFSYTWDFEDGTVSNERCPTHTYHNSGNYTPALNTSYFTFNNSFNLFVQVVICIEDLDCSGGYCCNGFCKRETCANQIQCPNGVIPSILPCSNGVCPRICLIPPLDNTTNETPSNTSTNFSLARQVPIILPHINLGNNAGWSIYNSMFKGKEQKLSKEIVSKLLDFIANAKPIVITHWSRTLNGSTVITVNISNDNIVGFNDLQIREIIPKKVIPSADYLLAGLYTIIDADPILGFDLPRLDKESSVAYGYMINQTLNQSQINLIYSEISNITPNQDEIDEILRLQTATEKEGTITKKVTSENGKTKVEQTFSPKKGMKGVDIYLSIPKCMAEKLNEVYFADKNYKIISDDPMVVWHFDEVNEDITINYEIFKDITDEDCQDQAVIIAVAKEIESSVLKKQVFSSNVFLVLFILPLITVIFIGSKRFMGIDKLKVETSNMETIVGENLKRVASYINKEAAKGMKVEEIVKNLKKVGWSDEMIKESIAEMNDKKAKDLMKQYFDDNKRGQ